ncbi:hypothetical protein LTR36_010704 [Oleoguttula mirabilis]|uniref:CNH domain-containing protein n=1 Tax=Oleoguttula mirabilis TaxID=1507867 RepID=A0AAV9JQV6_9PEZI|nr:hypothetical protein LTR36_010704 [Oleoguttula mirabilis]
MLSAFRAQPIHELKPKDKSRIESLLAYGDRLLVGVSTGSLRIYRVNESPPGSDKAAENNNGEPPASPTKLKPVELMREEEKFSRKPVQQLAIVKEANLLVSLSDGYISLHDLQTYQLVERLERTKGATCFTVTSNVVKDPETSVPSLVSRLAVGVKRKVMCWTWRDMEQEEDVAELNMEASAKSLTWVSGQARLVVGMDSGFGMVDIESQEILPVYKPASRQDPSSGELAGVRFGAVSSSGMGYMGMASWVPKPMATGLSPGHVLLAKDVNTLFTDIDGKALEKRQVPWSLAPEAIGYSYPYMLALQPPERGQLQIRNPDTLTLLQTLAVPSATILHVPQPNISLAHAGKGFLVASDRTIWRMNALPYPAQLFELAGKQRFDEAISLLNLLEDTLVDDKLGRIREIKIQKAIALFQQQKYRPALDLFTDAEAPPERVVALYPRSIAGELSSAPEISTEQSEGEHAGEDGPDLAKQESETQATKEQPSTPSKSMLSKFKSARRESADVASVKASPRADSDNMSIRPSRATPAKAAPAPDKPLEGDDLKFAVRSLCSFLAQARVQIQKHLNTDGKLKQDPPELDPETGKPAFANLLPQSACEGANDTDWQAELLSTAKLVDTTLFRAYMLALPSLAGPLFRLDNFCDPEIVQSSLYENDRYGDLIDFLHGKKLHRQALDMLAKFGKGEADNVQEIPDGMRGPERTVAYLKQLPPELIEIVLEFARWPIDEEPDMGMQVFLADSDYAEHLPRDKVLQFLADIDENLEIRYLEHVINELGDQSAEFHQQLVDLYLDRLKSADTSAGDKDQLKEKLECFLRKSNKYDKGATFRQLPTDDPTFFESRAIVLSAIGNHKQALSIYVFQIKDYAKAEEYCNRTYLSEQADQQACLLDAMTTHEKPHRQFEPEDSPDRPNIFAILLGLYLRPQHGEEKRWPQALDLLSKHGARLPASSTLDLMPDDLAVAQLQDYFRGRVRNATSILREEQVVRSLEGVRRADTERKVLLGPDEVQMDGKPHGRNRRVRITEEDLCKVCHKRFGASAIRVFPNNEVVHYGCAGKRAGDTGAGVRGAGGRGWG